MKTLLPILHSILGTKMVSKVDLRLAKSVYRDARKDYYASGSSDLTDAEYDALEDVIRFLDPEFSLLKKTGAKVGSKSDVKLKVPMPSLSKIKVENETALSKFLSLLSANNSGAYVSAKIDGSSVEVIYSKGKLSRIATRGDGVEGKNISHFIPFLSKNRGSGLPSELSSNETVVLRMEATVSKHTHATRYVNEYASDRAMASAVFNRHDASPALRHIDFVLLSVVSPHLSSADTDAFASKHGFLRPMYRSSPSRMPKASDLRAVLEKFIQVSPYSLDGLVVGPTHSVEPISEDLPRLTRSVKIDDHANAPLTEIVDIVWNPSSFGVLVPKAIIAPIKFGNVTVRQAALHNAKWAADRGAGIGAKVRVLRSGEIIPKIVEVVEKAEFTMPDPKVYGKFVFDGTRVLLSDTGGEVQARKIYRMFDKLGLEDLGLALAEKLVSAGYTETREALFLTLADVKQLPGVKESAKKIHAQLSRAQAGEFTLPELMNASGVFKTGIGETLFSKIASEYPAAFRDVNSLREFSKDYARLVESLGPARASTFKEGVEPFYDWVQGLPVKPFKREATQSGVLSGQHFSWTGYRSDEEESFVKALGGIVSSFGSKTSVLFFRPGGKASSKVDRAGSKAHTFAVWSKAYK